MGYDVKKLGEKMKAKGLPVLEDTAEQMVDALFEWLKEEIEASEGKLDDLALPFLPAGKAIVDKVVDKIDPSDNV